MKTDHDPPRQPALPGLSAPERMLRGLGVSPGIAVGPAYVVETGNFQVPEYEIAPDQVEVERQRFVDAAAKACRQIHKLKDKAALMPESAAEDVGFLLDAHLAMLSNSRLTRGVEKRIVTDRVNAESAVQAEITALANSFAEMNDSYIAARIAYVREVGSRLIRVLMQRKFQSFSQVPDGSIIIAEELTPADTALLD